MLNIFLAITVIIASITILTLIIMGIFYLISYIGGWAKLANRFENPSTTNQSQLLYRSSGLYG
jgi:hypothetical protein